jgi:hypothetical protein
MGYHGKILHADVAIKPSINASDAGCNLMFLGVSGDVLSGVMQTEKQVKLLRSLIVFSLIALLLKITK